MSSLPILVELFCCENGDKLWFLGRFASASNHKQMGNSPGKSNTFEILFRNTWRKFYYINSANVRLTYLVTFDQHFHRFRNFRTQILFVFLFRFTRSHSR